MTSYWEHGRRCVKQCLIIFHAVHSGLGIPLFGALDDIIV